MKPKSSEKQITRYLWILVIGGSLARLMFCFCFNPLDYLISDPLRHWLNGKWFLAPSYMGGYDAIGYQVYLFLVQIITGENRQAVALTTGLLSVGMPWSYYRAALEFGFSRNCALFLWVLIIWMPSLFVIYQFFMMETLLLFLIGVSLWMTGRYMRKGDLASFLAMVATWTATCLTKTIPFPLAAVCFLYSWWKHSQKISRALAATVLIIVMLVPNAIRSKQLLGYSAPFGNVLLPQIYHRAGTRTFRIETGKTVGVFGSASCYVQPLASLSPWMMERAYNNSTVTIRVGRAVGDRDEQRVYQEIHVSWRDRFVRWWENILLFLFAPPWPDSNMKTWLGWINYWQRWLWAPLIFILLDINLQYFRAKRFHLIPVATTVFLLAVACQNLTVMEGRYRKPVEPLLLLNFVWAFSGTLLRGANWRSYRDH